VRDALNRVDAVRRRDYAHAWAILLAEIGDDRALDAGTDFGSAELLALIPGPMRSAANARVAAGTSSSFISSASTSIALGPCARASSLTVTSDFGLPSRLSLVLFETVVPGPGMAVIALLAASNLIM
jgi:hypothetical protein